MKKIVYGHCCLAIFWLIGITPSSSAAADDSQAVLMGKSHPKSSVPQITNVPQQDIQQLLQGEWLCQETFKEASNNTRFDVNKVGYLRYQGNVVMAQLNDYITITFTQRKKRVVGKAIIIERGQEVIKSVGHNVYLSRLTQLDDVQWVEVDDNAAGRFIKEDYIPFLDQLAKEEKDNSILRTTYIDQLDTHRFRYHNDSDSPTYGDCYRINLDTQPINKAQ